MKIALVGNPNCGKTTLFNRLTGSKQKVGNWPGVTVEKKFGYFALENTNVELVDLPGLYSMEQIEPSQDEQIACDFLKQNEADVIINIVDAANLQRNLVLTSQLKELGKPILVVANMVDVATQRGRKLDLKRLSEQLGLPVVPFHGAKGTGQEALLEQLAQITRFPKAPVMENTESTSSDPLEKAVARHRAVKKLADGVSIITPKRADTTETLDKIVLNRWLGVPIFLAMMYLMFTIAVNVGAVFIDFFDIAVGALLIDGVKILLADIGAPQWLGVLLADGFGAGIQLVATFIPVIAVLYLCLSILEDSGYLSRAAFVIDRLMSSIGLPGNAFVPLIVGFGCNVPAVMASRTMGRESDRLLTIIMAPFMSCGARLTVYALFAAAFFPTNGANVVFGLYLLGIVVAVGSGFLFRKQVFKTQKLPSFTEMPAYHMPIWRNIFITTWQRLSGFIKRAGKTIVMVVILLSALNSIGTDGSFGNENTDKSLLAKAAQVVTPIFEPIGLKEENWPATVGVVTGMFAKEAIVGTLDALYTGVEEEGGEFSLLASLKEALMTIVDNSKDLIANLGDPLGLNELESGAESGTALLTAMAAKFNGQIGAFSYLVFILLYTPCVAVLGAIKRESGGKWMWLVIGWTTSIAYIMATLVYQASQLSTSPTSASLWIIAMLLFGFAWWKGLSRLGNKLNQPPTYQINLG
ncbi:ferrous iron transport protein B [Pseudoalteromonas piscicida]|uniref:Ferrous iron transport protein B n=1 Tax=Pseudoalteromonas piscicida TaxID=43662 RepID=A0AAQ2EVG3_PSEO7|nr:MULTISPECIES: ferrous iron transport protein B [Pseudoalteromonas]TMN40720.1 ferrous iron transport protein B [Pseudoalteromonas piscicida]TMN43733.1 ferrous iron transport protein B [Pseudoalteromonas piscicida]TMN50785.1 ferrous iron transport protein B [Pseudoalteromonas piscicida]TMN57071.1 ferrous iron transport protein B [Pseudoalteromonas piscicida]TMN59362.1 ferrous iron transport protein B [Pseudoalteromonas piscicida]